MTGCVVLLAAWCGWEFRLAELSGSTSLSDRGRRTELLEPGKSDDGILGPRRRWLLSSRPLVAPNPNVFRLLLADGDLDCFEEILDSAET